MKGIAICQYKNDGLASFIWFISTRKCGKLVDKSNLECW